MKWMLLCLGLGAAGIAAAEVTLEGFPTHWTQDEAYRTYTPEHCPPGCVAIAGAAIVQYYKVGEGPEQTSNTCRVNDEARTLSTADETYNWEKPDAVFPLHCYRADGQGGMTEVKAAWSFSSPSVSLGEDGTLTWAPNLPNRDYPSKARPPSTATGRTTPARTPASSASPWTLLPTDP